MISRAWAIRLRSSSSPLDATGRRLLAMLDQQPPQLLDHIEKRFAFLLDQHASQQNAQRADVAAQGEFFCGIGGVGRQLGEPGRLEGRRSRVGGRAWDILAEARLRPFKFREKMPIASQKIGKYTTAR